MSALQEIRCLQLKVMVETMLSSSGAQTEVPSGTVVTATTYLDTTFFILRGLLSFTAAAKAIPE